MRHQFNQISALAEDGNLDQIREYLARAVRRIPSLDMKFCENRAADSVIGYYCALARREGVPFQTQADLPEPIPALSSHSGGDVLFSGERPERSSSVCLMHSPSG